MEKLTYPVGMMFSYVLEDPTFSDEQKASFKTRCEEFDEKLGEEIEPKILGNMDKIAKSYEEMKSLVDGFRFLNGFPEFEPHELMPIVDAALEVNKSVEECYPTFEKIMERALPVLRVIENICESIDMQVDMSAGELIAMATDFGYVPDRMDAELPEAKKRELQLTEEFGKRIAAEALNSSFQAYMSAGYLFRYSLYAVRDAKEAVDKATDNEALLTLLGPFAPGQPIKEVRKVLLESKARVRQGNGDFIGSLTKMFGKYIPEPEGQ